MNTNITTPNAFLSAMTSNVNVGIDEVVNVFVAKWEDGLFVKKDGLSKKIKAVKQELGDFVGQLTSAVDQSRYEGTLQVLGLHSKVEKVEAIWENRYDATKNTLVVSIGIFDPSIAQTRAVYTKIITTAIDSGDVTTYEQLNADLAQLNAELVEVMMEIKSVSRKERQVRGKISEMKLEQSGFAELANNADLLKLITIN